jgi:tetratricopeptide (TPR) repeat protein
MAVAPESWYLKGIRLKQKCQYQKAIQAFNRVIDSKFKFAEAYFERGICYYKLGNTRQAADDLAAAAMLGCKSAELWTRYDRNRAQKTDENDESAI